MFKRFFTLTVAGMSAAMLAASPAFQLDFENAKEYSKLPRTAGVTGKGVQLQNQKLKIPAKGRLTPEEGTISLWFKPVNWDMSNKEFKFLFAAEMPKGKSGRMMVYKYKSPGLGLTFFFGQSKGKMGTDFRYTNKEKVDIRKGSWTFLTATWSKKESLISLYLNGKKICSAGMTSGMIIPVPENIVINPSSFSPSNPKHETAYDTIRFFNTALSENEIAMLYQQQKRQESISYEQTKRSVLTVPTIRTAPKIDGNFVDSEWAACARTTGFSYLSDLALDAQLPTDFYMGTDGKNLYFCTVARIIGATQLVNTQTERDSAVYMDDAMEIHLLPPKQTKNYHLIYNAGAAIYDRHGADSKWNGKWTIRTGIYEGLWISEGMIPLSELHTDLKTAGEWGFNVCRDLQKKPDILFQSVSPGKSFFKADGILRMGKNGVTGRLFVNYELLQNRQLEASLEVLNAQKASLKVIFTGELFSADGRCIRKETKTVQIASANMGKFVFSDKLSGLSTVLARITAADAAGKILFRQDLPLKFTEKLNVVTDTNIAGAELIIGLDRGGHPQAKAAKKVTGTMITAAGKRCTEIKWDNQKFTNGKFSLKGLAPGDYQLLFEFYDASGKKTFQYTHPYNHIGDPIWLKVKSGTNIGVVYPYTPLVWKNNTLSCLGRSHVFGKGLLPDQIISQGQKLFAQKPVVSAGVNGKEQNFSVADFKLKRITPAEADYVFSAKAGSLLLTGTLHCEFDGFFWYEWNIRAAKGNVKVDSLKIRFTYAKNIADFVNAHFFSRENEVGKITKPFTLKRFPSLWLGNLDVGLTFFTESFQNWKNRNTNQVYTITPEKDGTVNLTIALIDRPYTLAAGKLLQYGFGIEANPVKPTPPEFRSWRVHSHDGYNIAHPWQVDRKSKKYTGDGGFFTPVFKSDEAFLEQLNKFKQKKALFTVYLNPFLVSGEATEYQVFRKEWNNPYNCYPQCPNSSFTDYIVYNIDHLIKLGLQCVYVDSLGAVNCCNPLHGCGYVDENGKNEMTYPIRGMRNYMKRLYSLLHAPGRDQKNNFLWAHMSARTSAPLNAFVDFQCSGEEQEYRMMTESNYLKLYPLDAYQIYFMKSSGVVPALLPNLGRVGPKPHRYMKKYNDQLMVLALLHDSLIWMNWCDIGYLNKIYAKLDRWGYKRTDLQFLSYRTQKYVTSSNPDIRVSLYHLPKDGKTLAVIGNFRQQDQTVSLRIDRSLWKNKTLKYTELMSGNPLNPAALRIASFGLVIMEIHAK